jgi:hypothetical protein
VAFAAQRGDKHEQSLLKAILEGLWSAPISGRPELPAEEKRNNKRERDHG